MVTIVGRLRFAVDIYFAVRERMLVNGTDGAKSLAAFGEFQCWVLSSVYIGHVSNPTGMFL